MRSDEAASMLRNAEACERNWAKRREDNGGALDRQAEMPRSVFAVGITVAALLVASGILLLVVAGASDGVALMIAGFIAVVLTAVFTIVDSDSRA